MRLPPIISKATLKGLAKPDETHVVRVIAHEANNGTTYRLRCRAREYRFERDSKLGRHVLDIPVSVWMKDAPGTGGKFKDSQSIAEDFRTAERCPYSIHVLPIGASTAADAKHDDVPVMLDLLETLILRLAFEYDPERCKKLLPDSLKSAMEREGQSVAESLLLAHGRKAIVEFQNRMWNAENPPRESLAEVLDSANPEESPSQARARKMREAKAAKKAAQLEPA